MLLYDFLRPPGSFLFYYFYTPFSLSFCYSSRLPFNLASQVVMETINLFFFLLVFHSVFISWVAFIFFLQVSFDLFIFLFFSFNQLTVDYFLFTVTLLTLPFIPSSIVSFSIVSTFVYLSFLHFIFFVCH